MVIRKRQEKRGRKVYCYHEFTVRYSVFDAAKYSEQERMIENTGRERLTDFIMSKIAQDDLVAEITTAIKTMLDSGQLVFNSDAVGNDDTSVSTGNNAILGFLQR